MFYRTIRMIVILITKIIFRVKIEGLENVPKEGPIIICGNHIHFIDPVITIIALKRPVHYLAKKEIFTNPLKIWLLKKMNTISLNRESSDMDAYRAAVSVLKQGGVLGIFAQGARMQEIDIKGAKSGVSMFALKGNALVVPAYFEGSYKLFSKVRVRFGEPIDLSEYQGIKMKTELLEEITEEIMTKIDELGKAG